MAGRYELHIEQGATFGRTLTWRSDGALVDLTGWTARMQVRDPANDDGTPLLELTTEDGRIILGGAAGTIRLLLSAAETDALDWSAGLYDLELVEPLTGVVTRLLSGWVKVSAQITR